MQKVMEATVGFRVKALIWWVIVLLLILPAALVRAEDVMKLIVNQASLSKVQAWMDFLQKNEISVDLVAPADFSKVKSSYFIAIEGGMDDPAIQKLVTEVAGSAEADALSKPGAKKMFMKENVWQPGQKVLVFAGSNAEAASAARADSREAWMKYLKAWFDLGEGPGGLKAY
jgi:hypothetical protein